MSNIRFSELAQFQPKQLEAKEIVKKKKYTLYGGAAGGGKSYWLRWMALYLLMYYYGKYDLKGVRVGLFCEDYPALKERHLSKIPFEFPDWLGILNRSDHEFRLNDNYGGGVIAFRNLDDPSKYLSSEFASILIDELTKNTREKFNFLNMRMRWPGIADTKFLAATNPGEIGHGWVKKLWVTRDFSDEQFNQDDFSFVQSFYSDNKFIDESYEQQLNTLPEQLRRAYKEGDWDIFAGQYFTEFRRDTHVVEPFEIPSHWRRFSGLDYGYTNPSSVHYMAYDHDFDTVYVYDELYGTGMTYKDLAEEMRQKDLVEDCFADPAIWAKKDSPKSGAMELMDIIPETIFHKAKNDRVVGATLYRQRLKVGAGGQPKIKIFSNCKNLIRTLPELVHDDRKVEDVDTDGEDHAYDSTRYGLASFLEVSNQKKKRTNFHSGYRDPLKN